MYRLVKKNYILSIVKKNGRSFRCVFLALMFLSALTICAQGQDVEEVLKEKVVTVNGGVSANTTFYQAHGIDNRRDPFYWMLSGNLNFNILGIIQAPFSYTISQQDKHFSQPQPFNRFGISPRYKYITAHLGYRTMNFSEYTLAGNMFLGAGVEVMPENSFVRVSAMYGRLAKAVEKSAEEGLTFVKPTFKRMGYGIKLGLGRDKHMVDLILFRGWDDENSIPITEDVEVTPEENLVGAIHSKHQFGDKLAVELEYAYSLFTHDKRVEEVNPENYSFLNNLGGLFKPNISSEFNTALTSSLNYNGDWYQLHLKYRKVDPGYRTLGASFLNNGFQDITGGLSWQMLQQKMNVSTNLGIQQSDKEAKVRRVVYGATVSYNASERMMVNATYSNFSTSTRQTQIQRDILVDSLEYFQVTRNGSVNINYKLNSRTGHTLFFAGNIQDATDSQDNASTFFNMSVGQQVKIFNLFQLTLSATYNQNQSEQFNNTSMGPVVGISRSFLDGKVRSALSTSFLRSYLGNELQSEVTNLRWTNSIRVAKKHGFALNIYLLNSDSRGEEAKKYSEFRGMINYNYSF